MTDYLMQFVKANGTRADKVFKWKKLTLDEGRNLNAQKSHSIRLITTRRYYSEVHAFSLHINGEDHEFFEFNFSQLQLSARSNSMLNNFL